MGIPGVLDTLTRWIHHGPLWSISDKQNENSELVDECAKLSIRLMKRLSSASAKVKERWGLDFTQQSLEHWQRRSSTIRKSAAKNKYFDQMLEPLLWR